MKTKNRIVSLILILAMVLGSIPAYAVQMPSNILEEESPSTEDILIYESSDGLFKAAKSRGVSKTIRILPDTQFENIYSSASQDQYYQKINANEFVQVSKVEFDLTDYAAYTAIQKYSIPNEVLEGIASMAAWAEETNNNDARGVIFVADENTRSGDLNTLPAKTTYWKNHTFHNYQVFFTDMSTDWQVIAKGSQTTKNVLSAIKDIAIMVMGHVEGPLGTIASIFSDGGTCLSAWEKISSKPAIYCNANNKVEAKVRYDIYLKYTFYYDPLSKEDKLGCSSQRAIITRVNTDTTLYTSTGGKELEDEVRPYKSFYTPNYVNPEETAYNYQIGIWVERVQGEIYNVPIYFTFVDFNWPSDWPDLG